MGSLAHRKLANLAVSLGATRLMALSLGTTRLIISSHPETAREILSGSSFSDRPIKESARLLMFERAIGFAPSGKYWRHLRRIAANHMFSPRRISCLEGLRHRVADEMAAEVRRAMEEKGVVELRKILQKGSLSNIIESVFGCSLEKEEELGLMVKEGYELITEFNWEDHFPNLKFLDFHGVKRRCHKLSSKVRGIVGQIVQERKKSVVEVNNNGGNDFLSALLALPKEDQLSDSDMVAVLWEVLRMHPPGPLLSWARLAIHDVHVGKCFIPAGTTAMVNMWAITHDPSIWKDPWTFRPERFLEEAEDVSIMGSDLRLAPFGSGRRVCPGKALGLATVQLWLARLLHRFRWLPAQQHVDLSETLRLSLEMKRPLACQVVPREADQYAL
ncbi:Cytochrome P450 [Corchorus olitorius]|uniref:Cytochrome P450 n=1 Tax=Corchorus olitorius TaxID=93759 RepID=A0A1R3J010_9ROSI|nr:Cytochrome P450 [Corchorus olitorius]